MTIALDAMLAGHTPPRELQARLAPWSSSLHEGILVLRSTASQWLIDLHRSTYQRLATGADPERHLLTGTWTRFTELEFSPTNGVLVITPSEGPALRTHALPTTAPRPTNAARVPPPAAITAPAPNATGSAG